MQGGVNQLQASGMLRSTVMFFMYLCVQVITHPQSHLLKVQTIWPKFKREVSTKFKPIKCRKMLCSINLLVLHLYNSGSGFGDLRGSLGSPEKEEYLFSLLEMHFSAFLSSAQLFLCFYTWMCPLCCLLWHILHLSNKCGENQSCSFCVILLTDRKINKGEHNENVLVMSFLHFL